ncbi:AAA family ATPase [Nanoarchaeota archaeon]
MNKEKDLIDLVNGWIQRGQDQYKNKLKNVKFSRSPYLTIKKILDNYLTEGKSQIQFFIMPGLKGVGKTTLLLEGYKYLIENKKIPTENVVLIDVNRLAEGYNSNLFEFFNIFEKHFLKQSYESLQKPIFFLIDEAHYDPKWDQATKVLAERSNNIFFVITGSSALRLASSDIERRSNVQLIFPLNFQEYAKIKYGIFTPTKLNTSQYIRKALFELDTNKSEEILKMVWKRLKDEFIPQFSNNINKEIKEFLTTGGFPFTLLGFDSKYRAADALVRSIDKVVLDDIYPLIPMIQSQNARKYFAILHCLIKSLGSPNSKENIYESLKPLINLRKKDSKLISSISIVHSIIDNLIKTRIIFPVKPFSAEEKTANYAWKYYFATSTVVSSILIDMGKFNEDDPIMWGKILENEVAAILEKNRQLHYFNRFNFDYRAGGADFIIDAKSSKRVFEVSNSKNKEDDQVVNTMLWTKANFGIVIGDFEEVYIKNNVLHIPKLLILLI